MVAITIRASGPVEADEAWERYARPARWSSWAPQISRVECNAERLAVGARGRVFGPLGVSVDFVVEAWDEAAREWAWTAHRGPLRLHLVHGVEATDRGSATWLRASGLLPVVVGYVPVARFALRGLVH